MKNQTSIPLAFALAVTLGALAQVPGIITYQGRLSVGGTNVFDGVGLFKFALVSPGTNVSRQATATGTVSGGFLTLVTVQDGGTGYLETPEVMVTDVTGSNAVAVASIAGGAVANIAVVNPGRNYSAAPTVTVAPPPPSYVFGSFWSNDGTSSAGSEPALAVSLSVNEGAFTVNLGDTTVPSMTAAIPAEVFLNPDVRLRIWFSDGTTGFQQFYPDQRLTAAPYALVAGSMAAGAVTQSQLAHGSVGGLQVQANAINSQHLADKTVTSAKLANAAVQRINIATGAVGPAEIANGAVGAAQLADGAVGTAKLAEGGVTQGKLAHGSVGGLQVQANAINSQHLADKAVTSAKLANGAVTTTSIQDGTVTEEKLAFTPLTAWVPTSISVFTNSGTWIKPAGVSWVYVKMWGGGGGGATNVQSSGGGGGGGGYCEGIVAVTGNVQVTVGAGGTANSDGGDSSFLSLFAGGGRTPPGGIGNAFGGTASGGAINVSGARSGNRNGGDSPFGGGGKKDAGGDVIFPGGGGFGGTGGGAQTKGGDGLVIIYF